MLEEGQPVLFSGVRKGASWWVRLEGWFRWSAHPLGGAEPRDHAWCLRNGGWVLAFLHFIVYHLGLPWWLRQ